MCALQTKVFVPERGPVIETCAGFSSTARLMYPQTDANDDTNIVSHSNSMAIHPVSGESSSELGHHVHLRRDENPKHYHPDHLDRLSNCSTWTPAPVPHSHKIREGKTKVEFTLSRWYTAVTHTNHPTLKRTMWLQTLVASEQVTRHHIRQIYML